MWSSHPYFKDGVETGWQHHIKVCGKGRVAKILKLLKRSLRELNSQTLGIF